MNTLTGEILTLPKMSGSVSTPKSLSGNVGAKTINIGGKGDDGATFTPSVSADGIISWTNDKDLPNPEPVNIKGDKGDKGDRGEQGIQGKDGYTPVKGVDYFDGRDGQPGKDGSPGKDGADGKDGTSATHSWNGTVLTITSASGTSSADLKGDPGEPGVNGTDYILMDADKIEIAEMAAELVEVPDSGGNVVYDEEQELTEEQKAQARANIGAQPVGEYLTEVPEGYAKNEDIKKVDRKVDTLWEVVSKFHSNIVETASGEIITVYDASDQELAGLRIFGKTTQNGTPTPDAPVPLESIGKSVSVMVCGKNMLDVSQFTNGSQLTITNGAITITTSNNSIAVNTGNKLAKLAPSLEVGKNYILTFKTTGTTNMIFLYHANTYWDSNSALSITQKHLDSTVFLYASGKSTTATITDMMIRFASASDASYEPYKEIQNLTVSVPNHLCGIPVTSGGNYTDENGQQWVCDEVDFEKGVYVQRVDKHIFDGTSTDWVVAYNNTNNASAQYGGLSGRIRGAISNTVKGNVLCSAYQPTLPEAVYNHLQNNIFCVNMQGQLRFYNSTDVTTTVDIASFAASMAGVEVIYELAEEKHIPLSEIDPDALAQYAALHTNYPNTTIFNDGGAGMEVKYVSDAKRYIDKKFAELSAALLNQ